MKPTEVGQGEVLLPWPAQANQGLIACRGVGLILGCMGEELCKTHGMF